MQDKIADNSANKHESGLTVKIAYLVAYIYQICSRKHRTYWRLIIKKRPVKKAIFISNLK